MRNLHHTFYDDNLLIDLRFLVAAETWEDADDEAIFGMGAILEVGGSAQRLSTLYTTKADRDTAFGRLLALHQTFEAHVHAPTEDDE